MGEGPGQVCIDSGNLLCLFSPLPSPLRPHTAPHSSFLESVLTGDHQDCLIETPSEARLKFSSPSVRRLSGLPIALDPERAPKDTGQGQTHP